MVRRSGQGGGGQKRKRIRRRSGGEDVGEVVISRPSALMAALFAGSQPVMTTLVVISDRRWRPSRLAKRRDGTKRPALSVKTRVSLVFCRWNQYTSGITKPVLLLDAGMLPQIDSIGSIWGWIRPEASLGPGHAGVAGSCLLPPQGPSGHGIGHAQPAASLLISLLSPSC